MLWIALHLPALSLQAFAATLGTARLALPLALLDGHRIQGVNRIARQLGVQPGQKRATALALAPQLVFGQADAARDAQALRAVAFAALAFTPSVALDGPAAWPCVLLDVQASLRYFGGLARLQQRLRAALAPLQFSVRMAVAPTARGAALLARWRDDLNLGPHDTQLDRLHGLLESLPVTLLDAAREHAEVLQGMGLHTVGDLRRLPRAGLARRCGDALLAEIDRARGERAEVHDWVELPAVFEARLELYERTDSSEQLLHGAAALLVRLVAWARARQLRIGAFTLAMRHEPHRRGDGAEATTLDIALADASNDAAHLQGLLRERLARLALPAAVSHLSLRCDSVVQRAAPNGELFATQAGAREGLMRLVERLRARLGSEQVQRPLPVADHRPERGTAWQPVLPGATAGTPPPASQAPSALQPTRPVWLLAPPQPLHERQSRPLLDGRPLQLLSGPERIEAGWWDGDAAARDYFIAQAHDRSLVWVYRARLAAAATPGEGWFLHGRFG